MTEQKILPEHGYLRLKQILKLIPVSKSTWWKLCKAQKVPQPLKLTNRITVWKKAEIIDYINGTWLQQSNQ